MDVLELLASDNFITFSKSIAKKYGVDAAILLGTMCSWQKFFGGEFYKSQEELKEETCLGIYEIKEAVKVLSSCGILTVERKGLPAKNYYLVSANKLGENLLTSELEITQQEVGKSPDYNNKETIKKETRSNKQVLEENTKRKSKPQELVDLFNSTCVSLPKVTVLSTRRERTINAMLKEFTVEQFTSVFKKAEASKFLTGKNKNNWRANFDWLMNATNFAKVLDGNYDDYVAPHDGMSGNPEDDLPF